MIEIVDFLINIKYIQFLIMVIQNLKEDPIICIIFLLFLVIGIVLFALFIFFIIEIISTIYDIIYVIILNKEIKCNKKIQGFIIKNYIILSISIALGIIFSITVLTFTMIRNEEIEIIEPNRNKDFIVLVGEKEKFKNFPRRTYISLTKEYALKKIGLDKYIDIKKTLHFDNYELNEIIEKVDTIINIDNNFNLSLDEKKYFKDKVISSKDYDEINDIRNEIYELIEEKEYNKFKRKEEINFKEQKKILKELKNL